MSEAAAEEEKQLREAFVECARFGELEDLRACVGERPDLIDCARDARGNSALHMAAANNHLDVARLLLSTKATTAEAATVTGEGRVAAKNENGSTPLHWAVLNGHVEMVQLLLDHGADPAAPDSQGKTPIVLAEGRERYKISVLLLKAVKLPETTAPDADFADAPAAPSAADPPAQK